MDKRDAVKRIAELQQQMADAKKEIERLCDEHQIEGVTTDDGEREYYPVKPKSEEESGDDEWRESLEGSWVSSSDLC